MKKPKCQTIFLKPNASKKAKFVKFGVKKANLATLKRTEKQGSLNWLRAPYSRQS